VLRTAKIIKFGQKGSQHFFIIHMDATITIYHKRYCKLDACHNLYMSPLDEQYVINNTYDYQNIRFDLSADNNEAALVLGSKIIHLTNSKDKIVEGVLKSEDL